MWGTHFGAGLREAGWGLCYPTHSAKNAEWMGHRFLAEVLNRGVAYVIERGLTTMTVAGTEVVEVGAVG